MISEELQKKIDSSIKLLQVIAKGYNGEIEVAYSGGKDSDVILQLAKEAGIKYRAIYKNTTIDPPGTIAHAIEMGAEILRPAKSFFQLVAEHGFPNRHYRFCCGILKEYKVLDKVIIGVRKAESRKRKENYQEPTECRYYGSKKDPENHVEAIYPLLEWTDQDVLDFILDRGIKCAPIYYNRGGQFQIKRRLGCQGCPLASFAKRKKWFLQNPRYVKAYIRAGKKFYDTHPDTEVGKRYSNVYEWFTRDVLFVNEKKWEEHKMSFLLFPEEYDYKSFLEKKYGIDLTID